MRKIREWNAAHKVGRLVRYWTGAKEGDGELGYTTTEAFLFGGHTACVMVDTHAAVLAITHVEPTEVDPPPQPRVRRRATPTV